jgi:dipeptidyl aminopeptidase/acylaminoacyl peptidase
MPCHAVWTAALALAAGVAPPAGEQSAILTIQPVDLPAYESYSGIEHYAPTREGYEAARNDPRFVMERLTYRSEGLAVHAYVYRPLAPPSAPGLPVVVFNRGSYVRDEFAPEVLMAAHRLAPRGFLVVAPMLRGSGGAEGRDEMGGAEVADVLNLLPVLEELPYADASRVFLYGESRGGMTSLLAAKRGFPARAMAVYGAIADFDAFLAEGQPARRMAATIWPDFPEREEEIVESRSAVRWAGSIDVPVLIIHGADDEDVSPLQALSLAGALERAGGDYEVAVLHGTGHVITERAAERDAAAERWFRTFDPDPAAPRGPPGR